MSTGPARGPADSVTAVVRSPEKAADLRDRGVRIAVADYNAPETFDGLFTAGDTVLLISGTEFDKGRVAQHKAVLDAAAAAGVALFAYTSALGSLTAALADDHRATEQLILASGVPYVLLRNAGTTRTTPRTWPPYWSTAPSCRPPVRAG